MTLPRLLCRLLAVTTTLFSLASGAAAGDDQSYRIDRNTVVGLRGGVLTGTAHEYVYYDNGQRMSELIWDLQRAYTLTGDINYKASSRWSVYAAATFGFSGNNYMDDYDWLGRPATNWWTDHSWHDDTKLDHYLAIDAHMGYDFLASSNADLIVLGGFKYTDLQWTARGGCYTYSVSGFRDTRGCFTDGEKGITYEQSMPAIYGGVGAGATFGRVTFAA